MIDASRVVDELQQSPYFRGIPANVLHSLAIQVEERRYRPGQSIVARGAAPGGMGMVSAGTVEVLRPGSRGEAVVTSRLGAGMWLGVVELLEGGPGQASWVAADRVQLWWLSDKVSRRVLGDLGPVGSALRRALILTLSRQLLAANDFLRTTSAQTEGG